MRHIMQAGNSVVILVSQNRKISSQKKNAAGKVVGRIRNL